MNMRATHMMILLTGLGTALTFRGGWANVKPSFTLSDHMVLQRGMAVPVWGTADAGESVTIRFNGQSKTAVAGADGKWAAKLDAMQAGGPFAMTIQGKNTVTLQDAMVGEVWLASGQSNMDKELGDGDTAKAANFPLLRYLTQRWDSASQSMKGVWEVMSPATAPAMSKTAFYFGRDLQKSLGIAVGVLIGAQGSTHIQRWVDPKVIPADRSLVNGGDLFYKYIEPLRPFGIRGAIWYQGESDADGGMGFASVYGQRLQALIKMWRKVWAQGDYPFYVVQLPNYHTLQTAPAQADTSDRWAYLREEQKAALALPNTALAVTIDAGEANNIHPNNKSPYGYRLSLQARALIYGETNLVHSGPILASVAMQGNRVHLRFTSVGGGLIAKDAATGATGGALKGFTLAGADNIWYWADAQIHGDTVTVSSAKVGAPTQVRYAWADNPVFNLYNAEGLPASPFKAAGSGAVDLIGRDVRGHVAPALLPKRAGRNVLGRAAGEKPSLNFTW